MKRLGVFLLSLDGMVAHYWVSPSIKLDGLHNHLHIQVERGAVRVTCLIVLPESTTQCPRPGLEPGPLDPGTNALTMRPPRLTRISQNMQTHTCKLNKI